MCHPQPNTDSLEHLQDLYFDVTYPLSPVNPVGVVLLFSSFSPIPIF